MKKFVLIGSLFFLSGLTSLVYQTLWVRVLSLGVGSTSTALSLVLSIFFAGLSLGAFLAGRWIQRSSKPILTYGVVEGVIGLYSLILLPILFHFHSILSYLPLVGSFSWLGFLLKFVLVFLLLLLPTTLMGASLPILIQIFIQSSERLGKRISLLYGINTMGAVVGAFLSGFILIPLLGITSSNTLAAFINFGILGLSFLLQKAYPQPKGAFAQAQEEKIGNTSPVLRKLIPWVAAATGFCSIAAEVVWNKYLGIFLGSNVFGLSLILALFLGGIAIGSLVLSFFIEKIRHKERLFLWLLFACALSIFLTTHLLNWAPVAANVTSYFFPRFDLFLIKSVIAAFVLFPPGAVLGALLPLGIRLCIEKVSESSAVTGRIYAINTIGSILGSCLAGLILIPWVGSTGTILLSIGILLFLGIILVIRTNPHSKSMRALIVLQVFSAAILPFSSGVRFENIIKSAYLQQAAPDLSFAEATRYFAREYEEFRLIVEGKTGIISLSHDPQDGPNYKDYLRLKTNGLNESIYDTKNLDTLPKYEALLGFLPLALTRNPERAFIVGYGGGYTVDFMTSTDLDHVFVAELEDGILQAADFVYQKNNPLLLRKNLQLEIEDARFVLASRTREPFDIIVSQPSHSWLAGVANLFTHEFFLTVKDNLTDEGVFSQWLNLYNMNPEVLKSILHTFFTVFPHGYIFTGASDQEMILLGSKAPLKFNLQKLEAMATNKENQRKLVQVPIANGYDVLAQYTLSREEVLKITAGSRLNTDRNAFAEVTQSRLFYTEKNYFPSRFLLEAYSGDFNSALQTPPANDFYPNLMQSLEKETQRSFKMGPVVDRYKTAVGDTYELAYQFYQLERYASAQEVLEKAKGDYRLMHLRILNYLALDLDKRAWEIFKQASNLKDSTKCFGLELSFVGGDSAQEDRWKNTFESNREYWLTTCGPYLTKSLGLHYLRRGNALGALAYLEAYYEAAPQDMEAYRAMVAAYVMAAQKENAKNFFSYLDTAAEKEERRLLDLAGQYERKGFLKDAAVLKEKTKSL